MNENEFNNITNCDCGVGLLDECVKVKNKYSLWGWYMWSQGSTVVPKKMEFYCTKCNKVFYKTKDKQIIKNYLELNPY
jgi:hypothetical protein